jgi:hypothetical protein
MYKKCIKNEVIEQNGFLFELRMIYDLLKIK